MDVLIVAKCRNNKNLLNQYINRTIAYRAVALSQAAFYPKLILIQAFKLPIFIRIIQGLQILLQNHQMYMAIWLCRIIFFSGGVRKCALQIAKIEVEISDVEIDNLKNSLTKSA